MTQPQDSDLEQILIDLVVKTQRDSKFDWELPKDIEVDFPELEEATQKLNSLFLKRIEDLIPKESKINSKYSTSLVDRITYDQGFNDCRAELIRKAKEKYNG